MRALLPPREGVLPGARGAAAAAGRHRGRIWASRVRARVWASSRNRVRVRVRASRVRIWSSRVRVGVWSSSRDRVRVWVSRVRVQASGVRVRASRVRVWASRVWVRVREPVFPLCQPTLRHAELRLRGAVGQGLLLAVPMQRGRGRLPLQGATMYGQLRHHVPAPAPVTPV